MANNLRYDGKVVIVTGAGGGLGRAYALLFGSRGAKVVVNDLGTSTKGEVDGGKKSAAADKVVAEIKAAGGTAVANYDSVEDGAKIVKTAMDAFGRVDVLINNAGILRDVSFVKMTDKDWDMIYRVHLKGAYACTKAVWPVMREQGYGRIIMTASAAGLYGNFGQANYAAMKLALHGFAQALSLEGAKANVHVNTIAPVAGTRMTATVMPPELVEALKPEFITPLVAYLCHDSCEDNGAVFEVGAGWVSRLRWQRSAGVSFDAGAMSCEAVRDRWEEVNRFDATATYPTSVRDSMQVIVGNLSKKKAEAPSAEKKPTNKNVDLQKAMAHQFAEVKTVYTPRDTMLYALAVGASRDPMDASDLRYTYENHEAFAALPTMGVIFPFQIMLDVMGVDGLTFNPMMLLHGEQNLVLHRPLPTSGELTNQGKLKHIYDKGKGALVVLETTTRDAQGQLLCTNEYSLFIRGLGGFGGERGGNGEDHSPPSRPADRVVEEPVTPNQALIYRLGSNDMNPLHADPSMAAMGGFQQPILHGLCTLGVAAHGALRALAGNDPANVARVACRFSRHVFPGETIVTELWTTSPTRIVFRCKVKERPDAYCLTNGLIELRAPVSSSKL